jgi:hypothetical protein
LSALYNPQELNLKTKNEILNNIIRGIFFTLNIG